MSGYSCFLVVPCICEKSITCVITKTLAGLSAACCPRIAIFYSASFRLFIFIGTVFPATVSFFSSESACYCFLANRRTSQGPRPSLPIVLFRSCYRILGYCLSKAYSSFIYSISEVTPFDSVLSPSACCPIPGFCAAFDSQCSSSTFTLSVGARFTWISSVICLTTLFNSLGLTLSFTRDQDLTATWMKAMIFVLAVALNVISG